MLQVTCPAQMRTCAPSSQHKYELIKKKSETHTTTLLNTETRFTQGQVFSRNTRVLENRTIEVLKLLTK